MVVEKTNANLAAESGKTNRDFKDARKVIKQEQAILRRSQVLELKKQGWNDESAARIMNISVWTVRAILKEVS